MKQIQLTNKDIKAAYTIAIFADVVQLPLSATSATVILTAPAEFVDFALDCVVGIVLCRFLGFRWLLLPAFAGESIPGFDLLPTWTASIALLVKIRRDEEAQSSGASSATAQENGANVSESAPAVVPKLPPPLPAGMATRLSELIALLKQNLISQEEFDAKRQQILAEL